MSRPNADLRQLLSRLLDEERQLLLQLESLLATETEILLRDDAPEALENACRERQQCMIALLRLQEERLSLLRLSGFSADHAGLASLIRSCDPERILPARWAECTELAKRCRDLNDHNGALVNSRMRRIQGMLEVLTGKRTEKVTYGRLAQQGFGTRGRVLATEA